MIFVNHLAKNTFRDLPKVGFNLRLVIGTDGNVITLKGQTVHTKVAAIQKYVQQTEGIHIDNQRLFLAGEEISATKTLADYHIDKECTIQIKSYLEILVSNLETPGPILTEVEVDPKRDEHVIAIKRRIEFKLGLQVDKQRLFLTSDEMTTFSRRQPLDDTSLVKRYLPPSCGCKFLEIRIECGDIHQDSVIAFRVPMPIAETRLAASCKTVKMDSGDSVALPHMDNINLTVAWLILEIDKSKIIRRDPLVSDLIAQLQQKLKTSPAMKNLSEQSIDLKFCQSRTVYAGERLIPSKTSSTYYQIRSGEQMIKVCTNNTEIPESKIPPMVPVPKPIQPLSTYDERATIYTSPAIPTCMSWTIAPSDELDLGANPSFKMEVSGFSYSRQYESWDIAAHYKTYVEILLEGTFYVGDIRKNQNILNDEFISHGESEIFYTQHLMEVTLTGPENATIQNRQLVNKNPMKWYRKSAEGRQNKTMFWEQTLDRQPLESSPFRYDSRPMNLPGRTEIHDDGIAYGNNGQSQIFINNWYFGKERITHLPLSGDKMARIMDATCERGVTISGNPTLKVTYKARSSEAINDEQSNAFDFRIQAQFYICTLEEDFNNGVKPSSTEKFTVSVKQQLCRTKRVPNRADERSIATSPDDASMRKTLTINVANMAQLNAANDA